MIEFAFVWQAKPDLCAALRKLVRANLLQEIPRCSRNPKISYHVLKTTPRDPNLGYMNAVHILFIYNPF
jgi:hypothetical protein